MIVYGPYKRKDGRSVVIHYDGKTRRTQSYPRYLMEQHLNRQLEDWEQVDHKDNDPTNNAIENLQLLTVAENNRKSAIPAEMVEFICPVCGEKAVKEARNVRSNHKKGKAGPYCSRRCAGKVHH